MVVADVRWERFVADFAAGRSGRLFADLPGVRELAAGLPGVVSAVGGGLPLAVRLGGVGAGERRGVVLGVVRDLVVEVLGYAVGTVVEEGRSFRELGFDSLTAVEFRNRLAAVTGLRLPATLVFDYPDVGRLAGFVVGEVSGSVVEAGAGQPVVPAVLVDDPVVVVGMACRFPGGVDSPEGLWELLAGGGDAMGVFQAERGWVLDSLYSPDHGGVGPSYALQGGFV
ncbi:acyl carrier protein, partial [Parafrankia sp. FMc2]|uniref:acyl carrier protein n=1 Tax=Parafrankia sp. FMc2 TaxID=3233196 RepID=UPI0034D668B2